MKEDMRNNRGISIVTLIVLIIVVLTFFFNPNAVAYLKEYSDLIAVIVSSLAFLWLIFGYTQQAKAFNAQLSEIKIQNDNNRELLEQTKLQTQAEFDSMQIEKEKWKQELTNNIRPTIVFHNTGKDKNNQNTWVATNVGKSPALNLIISCAAKENSTEWNKKETVLFPVLHQNKSISLNWTTMHGALVAICSDIENNFYTTMCSENKNKIFKRNKYPKLKPTRFEYQLRIEEMNKME